MKNAIVLAAGKGTRMRSDTPKVLHNVLEMPMAGLIVQNLKKAGADRIVTVVGYGADQVKMALNGECEFAVQEPQLGTGHAVMCANQLENEEGVTLVVNGDCPCIESDTLVSLYKAVEDADMAVLTVSLEDAKSYGRVIRDENNRVLRIVEFKDCNEEEAKVKEINTGIYAFNNKALFEGLKKVTNDNAQHEYYITDLVEILNNEGKTVKAVLTNNIEEVQGVNDCVELAHANAYLRNKINTKWMKEGVTMIDPMNTYIGPNVTFGHDVVLHPNVYLYGNTHIGDNVVVKPNTFIVDETVE